MRIDELLDVKSVDISEPLPHPEFPRQSPNAMILITINDNMKFRVVNDGGNIWWGMVPKTGTKQALDAFRTDNRTGIMAALEPALKKAIYKLLNTGNKTNSIIDIVSKTNKGRDLYRSWTNIHPDYETKHTLRGIQLVKVN